MKLRYWFLFLVFSINWAFISCNKNKSNPSFKAIVTCASCPCIGCPPTNTTSSATIYSVTGKIRSYQCTNITSGRVYLNPNFPNGPGSAPSTTINPDGSFTFTYSANSSYTSITLTYGKSNYQGVTLNKNTKTVPANQNCDIGTYDFNSLFNFYVRIKSTSNSTISNVYLNSQFHYTHSQPPTITPVLSGPFTDTILIVTHDRFSGWPSQDWLDGYDPYSESSYSTCPITFSCTFNNVMYTAQKNILKCNGSPTDTLYINLP